MKAIALLLLPLAPHAARAEPAAPNWAPTISARADRTQAHLGDPIAVTIQAVHRRDVAVRLGDTLDLGALTLLDRSESRTDLADGRARTEIVLRLAAFALGELALPPLEVTTVGPGGATYAARTKPVLLTIASLVGDDPDPKPRPNAPPLPLLVPDWRLVWAAAATLGLAAVVAAILWARRRAGRRARTRPAAPAEPPDIIALRALDALGRADWLARGEVKRFHLRLSEVLRQYLGARYTFDAVESTTAEIVARLGAPQRGLDVAALDRLLSLCDLVKFAKYRPPDDGSRAALAAAVGLVERTRPPRETGGQQSAA